MTSHAIRTGTALVGVAGALLLAGCSGAADAEDGGAAAGADYKDGTYTAEGSYQTPETVEQVSVTLTLKDGIVSDVEVTGDPQARETEQYQGQFIDGIAAVVDGKSIDELQVDRVAGSSLTSGGFNQAIEKIKEQASE
ncbi:MULTISPECIES: FMN-binding protein [unclassified Microbacterium]|uniref:FMN-binding protein n=1 Tax=unclassified Microbacterium TaxID=2609290 RepID=UPI0012F8337C|nr:FMN-binding protein [Microbacterium sp. MAH-37]MVQ41118.1 FMN-binding protein [Microbacterium sp. MAH-37]